MQPEHNSDMRHENDSAHAQLAALRAQIDRLDHSLVLLIANRFALTEQVGEIKARENLHAVDACREQQKLEDVRRWCAAEGVSDQLMTDILAQLMREAVRNHERIRAAFAERGDGAREQGG